MRKDLEGRVDRMKTVPQKWAAIWGITMLDTGCSEHSSHKRQDVFKQADSRC